MKTKRLGGLILSSPNPKKLAEFYSEVIGIPFEFRSHGRNTHKHWECDWNEIHFAILPKKNKNDGINTIVPSFVVDDIEEFIETHSMKIVDPIMNLGEAGFVAAVQDIDENTIRLWTNNER